jgi:hypothetical protein
MSGIFGRNLRVDLQELAGTIDSTQMESALADTPEAKQGCGKLYLKQTRNACISP